MNDFDYSLDTDVTWIKYADIQDKLLEKNIRHKYLIKNPNKMISVNNDIQLEGDNNFWGIVDSLYSIGSFSYSLSNFGYGIKIGRYCSIAIGSIIMGAHHYPDWISTSPIFYHKEYHNLNPYELTDRIRRKRKVNIGHDVWIGANVTLKSEVTIGNGAIIASNSHVTKDVAPFTIVGGNPAKVIRPRFNENIIELIQKIQWWNYHKNDLVGLKANDPMQFLTELQERINSGKIQKYSPKIITLKDLCP